MPTRDKFGPAERTNGTTVARVDGSGNKTWAGRQLMVRYAGVQVHCWGADIPSTVRFDDGCSPTPTSGGGVASDDGT